MASPLSSFETLWIDQVALQTALTLDWHCLSILCTTIKIEVDCVSLLPLAGSIALSPAGCPSYQWPSQSRKGGPQIRDE